MVDHVLILTQLSGQNHPKIAQSEYIGLTLNRNI